MNLAPGEQAGKGELTPSRQAAKMNDQVYHFFTISLPKSSL